MSLFSAKVMFNVPYLKIHGTIYQIQNKEKVYLFLDRYLHVFYLTWLPASLIFL